ncbi:MFS transporter [Rothia mucilaginosa]|uniref:MFS transporter n=1 Tax=Rothia mucilaginosa TaxID=43675 RepID=UPI0027BA43DC|nr:MFS transporter [Rothia mucilaginosa]
MIVAYILFILFPQNLALVYVALVLFYTPNTFIQMTAILALTDSIEYGQLKTGQRNEAVTLSVRPMLDKIAVAAAMTNGADPNSLTAQNIQTFNTAAFYVPLAIIVCSFLAFFFKVSISEKEHAKIVKELEEKLASA